MDSIEPSLAAALDRLAGGDLRARDVIIEVASERLRGLAHRMLRRFPAVRRWNDTDDVFQNAALRLHRALAEVRPDSPRGLLALAATHVKRELLDLARRHAGPMSYAANHETNVIRGDGATDHHVDRAAAPSDDLERWARFHETVEGLPDDGREIFNLVWYLGVDQKTIAGLLGCSERTVKYRWRAVRETVKAALGDEPPA